MNSPTSLEHHDRGRRERGRESLVLKVDRLDRLVVFGQEVTFLSAAGELGREADDRDCCDKPHGDDAPRVGNDDTAESGKHLWVPHYG